MKESDLARGEIEEAVALARAVGWNDAGVDWDVLLDCAAVRAVRDDAGKLVATCAWVDFGPVACVAKMIVHPDVRGRGLAKLLLRNALASRTDPSVVVSLVATALGRPVYDAAGFREVGRTLVHLGTVRTDPRSPMVRAFRNDDLDRIVAIDRAALGCDRSKMIRARLQIASRAFVAMDEDGTLAGYAFGVPQREVIVIGPVVAEDVDVATALVSVCAEQAPSVRVDVPGEQLALRRWLGERGAPERDTRAEMTLGAALLPGNRALRFALAAQAYG